MYYLEEPEIDTTIQLAEAKIWMNEKLLQMVFLKLVHTESQVKQKTQPFLDQGGPST